MVCHRYPGTKPSEYLGIEDKWTAFQLDLALALKGWRRDQEIQKYFVSLINWHILQVCRVFGAKGVPKTPPSFSLDDDTVDKDELPSLEQVVAKLGGAGTVLKIEK